MKRLHYDLKLLLRVAFFIALDICSVALAMFSALWVRFEFTVDKIEQQYLERAWVMLPAVILTALVIFYLFRLYQSLWTYASVMEFESIIASCVLISIIQMTAFLILEVSMPRSYYFLFGMLLTMFTMITRFAYRALRMKLRKRQDRRHGSNVMVIGAGEAASMIIKEILNSEMLHQSVRCVIDDAPEKQGRYIHGVRVVGGRDSILENVKRYKIKEIIIAMPSVSRKKISEIVNICKETSCNLKILPGMYQFMTGEVSISNIKDVEIEDLLGREPIQVDLDSIMGYVKNKVILVTGGGGSIGSELCRQLASHEPKQLIVVDIYENNAYDLQQELLRKFPDLNLEVLIASVRNTKRMQQIFKTYRPQIVYHAAAHKHVPLMEKSPNEAVKNNVFGTLKTVQAADRYGTERFVMISTDKAVNPTNIMGATKRICEMIIQMYNNRSKTEFVAVRFGNVLGSNGSIIPLFKKQLAEGGPLTVTHPDIIRYFMTIPEAVSLVLQAGAYAKGGEIFVLDMGEPVKILDLAKNLIRLSGMTPNVDIMIEFIGLRPGEKLYEEMLMAEEGMQDTENKLIHIGKPIAMDEAVFEQKLIDLYEASLKEPKDTKKMVQNIVDTYVISK